MEGSTVEGLGRFTSLRVKLSNGWGGKEGRKERKAGIDKHTQWADRRELWEHGGCRCRVRFRSLLLKTHRGIFITMHQVSIQNFLGLELELQKFCNRTVTHW